MIKSYSFDKKNLLSKKGVAVSKKYLESLPETVGVLNVEDNANYRWVDIDLLWDVRRDGHEIRIPVEVKTDEYTTGNFWLETVSNKALGTRGCFLKTEAAFFFYYFIKLDELYIIPVVVAREWFLKNLDRFRTSETSTPDENGNLKHITVGKIVSIATLLKEVPGVEIVRGASKVGSSESKSP